LYPVLVPCMLHALPISPSLTLYPNNIWWSICFKSEFPELYIFLLSNFDMDINSRTGFLKFYIFLHSHSHFPGVSFKTWLYKLYMLFLSHFHIHRVFQGSIP
jgi:hypothetical protein